MNPPEDAQQQMLQNMLMQQQLHQQQGPTEFGLRPTVQNVEEKYSAFSSTRERLPMMPQESW